MSGFELKNWFRFMLHTPAPPKVPEMEGII